MAVLYVHVSRAERDAFAEAAAHDRMELGKWLAAAARYRIASRRRPGPFRSEADMADFLPVVRRYERPRRRPRTRLGGTQAGDPRVDAVGLARVAVVVHAQRLVT